MSDIRDSQAQSIDHVTCFHGTNNIGYSRGIVTLVVLEVKFFFCFLCSVVQSHDLVSTLL